MFNLPDFEPLVRWAMFGIFVAIMTALGFGVLVAWFVYNHVVFV